MSENIEKNKGDNRRKRNKFLSICAAFFLLVGLLWLLYWILLGRFFVSTEDAYVSGNQVTLMPQISAGVVAIFADDTDLVQQGQLIVQLDPTEHEIVYNEKKAALGETVRQVAQYFERVRENEARVLLREAEYQQKKLDILNREGLVDTGAISKEEFEQAQTNAAVARASLEVAKRELISSQLLVEGTSIQTHPLVKEAIHVLRTAYLNLIRCQIWAPVTGHVARRSVQVGDQVKPGDVLLTIVPLYDIWIDANYRETQLRHVRIGQPVTFTADLYGPELKYHGKVVGFTPGTGSVFSLFPPENAAGNWIKIVQRVPIRVSINPDELERHPLLLGLSMHTHIDIHDRSGPMLSPAPQDKVLYLTSIFDKQDQELAELDKIIQSIVKENAPFFEEEKREES